MVVVSEAVMVVVEEEVIWGEAEVVPLAVGVAVAGAATLASGRKTSRWPLLLNSGRKKTERSLGLMLLETIHLNYLSVRFFDPV